MRLQPAVRPVPLEIHIDGFAGRHYCPRMATMNKPIFRAITEHSPTKPVLVFVSSRRQTRLTAMDLIAFCAQAAGNVPLADDDGDHDGMGANEFGVLPTHRFLRMPESEMEAILPTIGDPHLRLMLSFGIGMHHAGLRDRDRKVVEELFVNQKIQVLIATSTLAWGVNFPAHLVVVKGTEFFDGKLQRYVDYPITDVLQMMGRAGRPQFDDEGACSALLS